MKIDNLNQWMLAVARAMGSNGCLEDDAIDRLNELDRISKSWIQEDEARQAQRELIEAAISAVETLEK